MKANSDKEFPWMKTIVWRNIVVFLHVVFPNIGLFFYFKKSINYYENIS